MTRIQRRSIAAAILLVASLTALVRTEPAGVSRSFKTWSQYLGGADSSQYSSLDQINKSTVSRLEVAWRYPSGDSRSYRFNPIVVDGTMFVLAKNNAIVALDAATGQEKCRTPTTVQSAIAGSTTGRAGMDPTAGCCISTPDR